MSKVNVYFGCWGEPGHYLWLPDQQRLWNSEANRMGIPTPRQLDGSGLFLAKPERFGEGSITFLPAPRLTILAWWGSPWDERGAVHAAYIVNGEYGLTEMWNSFSRYFPKLHEVIEIPKMREWPQTKGGNDSE